MIIKTEHGHTEARLADFAAIEPLVAKVREGYLAACASSPAKKGEHAEKVLDWCSKRFGNSRYSRDWDALFGDTRGSVSGWDQWIEAQPMIYRKWYYDPRIVAACIMGEDE